jgi:hypothetical protein
MRSCRIPDAGESAGIGSVHTETTCEIRRSDNERGERAATRLNIGPYGDSGARGADPEEGQVSAQVHASDSHLAKSAYFPK